MSRGWTCSTAWSARRIPSPIFCAINIVPVAKVCLKGTSDFTRVCEHPMWKTSCNICILDVEYLRVGKCLYETHSVKFHTHFGFGSSLFLRAKHEVLGFCTLCRGRVGGSPLSREPTEVKHYARRARLPRFTLTSAHHSFCARSTKSLVFALCASFPPEADAPPREGASVAKRDTTRAKANKGAEGDSLVWEPLYGGHIRTSHACSGIDRSFSGRPKIC